MAGLFNKVLNRKKFICPFCFSEYDKGRIKYFCPDCGKESMPTFAEKWEISIRCKNCGGRANVRICPNCGEYDKQISEETKGVIPVGFLDADDRFILGIMGASSSGKTSFLTAMLHELSRVHELRLALSAQNRYARDVQKGNCRNIYEDHILPCATSPIMFEDGLKTQLWEIKNLMRAKGNRIPSCAFAIYDAAGQDYYIRPAGVTDICKYISASDAIIITIDPLRFVDPYGMIVSDIRKGSGTFMEGINDTVALVNGLSHYIRESCGIIPSKQITVPVAIVLTKFDVILRLDSLPQGTVVRKSRMNFSNGKVNMEEIMQVHEEIRNWLYDIGERDFVSALECNFQKFCFFGVSSYGIPPQMSGFINGTPNPHRIIDPMLWILKEKNIID